MRKRSQMPRHIVFYKFLIINIAVLAVFYGITLYINGRITKSQEDDIYQASLNKLNLFMNNLETDIRRQKDIQSWFTDRYELQKLSVAGNRLTEYDKVSIIQRIQADVVMYRLMCEYCDNITISIPSIERVISVRPILDYYIGSDDDLPLRNTAEEPFTYLEGKNGTSKLFSVITIPVTPIEGRLPLYTVRIDIALANIESSMKTYFHENYENAVLIGADRPLRLSTAPDAPAELTAYFSENGQQLAEKGSGLTRLTIDGSVHWVTYRYSKILDAFFLSYKPERVITETLTSTTVTIWVVSAFTLLMVLISIFWIRRFFDEPMTQLMGALGRVEKGDLKMNIRYNREDEFHYVYEKFNSMVVELNRLIEQNYEQRIRAQQAELKQLQYHIKPHFLYNSIFLIYRMAGDGDMEAIREFSLTLGNYYRYITRILSQTIPMEREVDHISNYIKIQSMRFGDRIAVQMDPIPEGYQALPVLPLMLQPIVENAYHHGVSMMESGGKIEIHIVVDSEFLTVTVDDNGKGMTDDKIRELSDKIMGDHVSDTNTGLSNVHHRLRIHFGPESGLRLEPSHLGGLRAILRLKVEGHHD